MRVALRARRQRPPASPGRERDECVGIVVLDRLHVGGQRQHLVTVEPAQPLRERRVRVPDARQPAAALRWASSRCARLAAWLLRSAPT